MHLNFCKQMYIYELALNINYYYKKILNNKKILSLKKSYHLNLISNHHHPIKIKTLFSQTLNHLPTLLQ